MANDKVYIFDEENIRISVYEESQQNLSLVNDNPVIEVIRIYEPGGQGPKGNDGGSYVLPQNVVSSSQQIGSDISGSFNQDSSSLALRITNVELKTLISSSQQLTGSYDQRYELKGSSIVSSSQQLENDISGSFNQISGSLSSRVSVFETKTLISGSEQFNSVFESKGTGILSSSQQIKNDISGSFNSVSGSLQSRISYFENKTLFSSSQQLPNNLVSGSEQLTGSYDQRYHRLGTGLFSSSQQVQYNQIANIPSGILSSSQGFVLTSETSSFLRNEYSSSVETRFGRLEQVTSSFALKNEISGSFNQISSSLQSRISVFENKTLISSSQQVSFAQISNIPTGLVSSSQQINTGSFTGSFKGDGNGLIGIISSSYSTTSSFSSYALSASYAPNANLPANLFSSSQQVQFNQIGGLPTNLISGSDQVSSSFELRGRNIVSSSQQISNLLPTGTISGSEQLTGSYDQRYERKGSGLISSSTQVKNLLPDGTVSGSTQLNSVFELKGTGIFSSSQQVQYSGITGVPNGLISSSNGFISSSQQINQLLPNLVSSSQQINTGSFSGSFSGNGSNLNGVVSSSYALTSSYALNAGSSGLNNYTQTIGIRIVTQDVSIIEGSKGYRHIGFNSDIIKIRGIANTTGSINLNVKRNNLLLGNYQLSNQTGSIDSTLTGWTSSLNSNDLIEFYVSQSSTYITDLTFFMDLQSR